MVEKTRTILTQIYARHLTTINQTNFTFREIELISCLIHTRGIKKIALLLNIAPKTVETHIRNINLKINCNSQADIITFIENSGKLEIIREFYNTFIHPAGLPTGKRASSLLNDNTQTDLSQACLAAISAAPAPVIKSSKNPVFRMYLSFSKKTYLFVFITILIVCLGIFIPYQFHNQNRKEELPIRSDLIIPNDTVVLNRPKLMAEIEKKLKGSGLKAVAFIGIGGTGKTTLARQYAYQQKANIIWEINAETQESLQASFENLAEALVKTDEEQKILRGLLEVKKPIERENKILFFVKEHLRAISNWFLIYDNVENFSDIQTYFPRDEKKWGQGKVILTTQNTNMQNNKHLNNVIYIEALNDQQKLDLFTKIMTNESPTFNTPSQVEKNKEFLKSIPSFPLDVSIAAYYLKTTNISYQDYLENLQKSDQKFLDVQKRILKDSGDYVKTRYGIITLSIEHLVNANKDFEDLLLFISLLDSQSIPRELLIKYKDKTIVDNFIYNLRRYSLVHNELNSSSLEPTFSIHRSTQATSLLYLVQKLKLEDNASEIQSISETLSNYVIETIEKKNYREVEFLISHCKAFLNHSFFKGEIKEAISRRLGHIYTYLGHHTKAQKVFQESLSILEKNNPKNYDQIFQTVSFLGNSYRQLGHHEKAKVLLEQYFISYRQYIPKSHICIPQTLFHLGNVYRELGHYEKAKNLLEESLISYEQYHPEKHLKIAWVLIHLGTVYRQIGHYEKAKSLLEKGLASYKKLVPENHLYRIGPSIFLGALYEDLGEYDKAKTLFEQCHTIQTNNHSENQIYAAWVGTHLASVYGKLVKHEKAHALLKKSLMLYQKHLPDNNLYTNWVLMNLGNSYKNLGDYSKSKALLEKILITHVKYFGEDHIETARTLDSLGQVYLLEGQIEKAENLLNRALQIFEKTKHPEIYIIFEDMALLYQKKAEQAKKSGLSHQAKTFQNKAINYLKQALEVVKTHFPPDSPHIMRIQYKLKKIGEREIGS